MSSLILTKFGCILFLSRKCTFLLSLSQSILGICMRSTVPTCLITITPAVLNAASYLTLLTARHAEKARDCWPNSGLVPQQGHLASACTRLIFLAAALRDNGRFPLHISEGYYACIVVSSLCLCCEECAGMALLLLTTDSSYPQKYTFKLYHSKSQERNYTALYILEQGRILKLYLTSIKDNHLIFLRLLI